MISDRVKDSKVVVKVAERNKEIEVFKENHIINIITFIKCIKKE